MVETKRANSAKSFLDRSMTITNVIVLSGLVLLFGIGVGASSTPLRTYVASKLTATVNPSGNLAEKDFQLYWEVYNLLDKYYVDPNKLDADEMYNGSIKGMVEALGDAPTVFFDVEETQEYEDAKTGSYSGIGAELDFVDKRVVVVAPFEGMPADLAGLQPKDIITEVDGNSVSGKSLTEVVMEIRGEAGTNVVLTIFRPREDYKEYEIEITRNNVSAPSMRIVEVNDGIATVKISRFTDATLEAWVSSWNEIVSSIQNGINKGEVSGVVIDLRNNPGGYFDAAIVLASDFLPKDSVVSYQREKGDSDTEYKTLYAPRLEDVPLVVLVNGSSASASEIFSGAMKYYERATIVGESTYGKGTAQMIFPVSDGSSLHVTVSKWLLPDKSWINHDNTITPDVELEYDYDYGDSGGDNQLEKAKEILNKSKY